MKIAIYWFRNDLRLIDNPAFSLAAKSCDFLLPVYVHDQKLDATNQWNFVRAGEHRRAFLNGSLQDLRFQLINLGSNLVELAGETTVVLEHFRREHGIEQIYCEQIEAPEELDEIQRLIDLGFDVSAIWQSSMLDPQALPFNCNELPNVFTQFRQQIEKHRLRFDSPIESTVPIPPIPNLQISNDSKFDFISKNFVRLFDGGEEAAHQHMSQYFDRRLVDSYKETRNRIMGMDHSSKFSPWLAHGCISAKSIAMRLSDYEKQYGANDGTYWLWFELLWRDYFRFLHIKYGNQLYHSKGLSHQVANAFDEKKFLQWTTGTTGVRLVDAGMRELLKTGFLSNRMRQIVASFWIYEMNGNWQAGAAWFESQLIDYDVYSNQGNWLYIAGKGTDPRGGRAFNLTKQANEHDPDGVYQNMWLND